MPTPDSCDPEGKIRKNFRSGAKWNLCTKLNDREGVVLSQIFYTAPNKPARRVLGEASLSEILVTADANSSRPLYSVVDKGLGKSNIQELSSESCQNGKIRSLNGKKILCRTTDIYPNHYRSTTHRQGQYFDLHSNTQLTNYNYTVRWRFYENGIIEPSLGTSGSIPNHSPKGNNGFTIHAIWRLDFDIGSNPANDVAEEITSTPSQNRLTKTKNIKVLKQESGSKTDPETKKFWRVRDGNTKNTNDRFISYEIAPSLYNHSRGNVREQPWLDNDIYFTRHHPCERHPAKNHLPHPGCSFNAINYVSNKEKIDNADIVVWYKQSQHHIPRNEDTPYFATIWNTFQLVPRDWHAQNPF